MTAESLEKTSPEVKKLCNKSPHHLTPTAWVVLETKGTNLSDVSGDAIAEGEPLDNLSMDVKQDLHSMENHKETAANSTNTGVMQAEVTKQIEKEAVQDTMASKNKDHSKNTKYSSQSAAAASTDPTQTSTGETWEKNKSTEAKAPMQEENEAETEETIQSEVVEPKEWQKWHDEWL